jgi:glycosyltransferase involved in cell wall biosynthesis
MPTVVPNVLIVGDFPPPYGGVAVHVELLRRAVRERGGRCTVLDIGKGQIPADGVVAAGGYPGFAARLFAHALGRPRIHVHTSGANPKSWTLATACAAAARIARVPPVITFHSGLGPDWLAEDAMRARIAGAVANAFAKVIAVSEPIRDALLTCGVARERIEVLPAFSSAFLEPGNPPPGFRELRQEASPLYCAMLAPGPVYGAEVLLRAFSQVYERNPRARLALYGPGTTELDCARTCGSASPAVRRYGELQRASALAVIAGADVYVRPTLADGDSVSVREAVALGRTVVATSVGTRPSETILVPPGNAATLAAAMMQAAEARPALRVARNTDVEVNEDCVPRLLELYGFAAPAPAAVRQNTYSRATTLEPTCAASAAS